MPEVNRKTKVAYLVTHPIQYQAPMLRWLAQDPSFELKVFFQSDYSLRDFVDPGFGRSIAWDTSLLEGFNSEVLPSVGSKTHVGFFRPWSYGLAARLKKERFDVLWVHGYARWFHWIAILQAKRLGLRVLIRDEATPISARRGPVRQILKKLFFALLKKLCNGFLAIGSLNQRYYREFGIPETRLFSMPYAVDNIFFQKKSELLADTRESARAKLGIPENQLTFLYAGKLSKRKRPQDLLEAYIRLSADGQKRPPSSLVIVGDGEERRALERRAASLGGVSVVFTGFKNQSALPGYYALCDVFVIPSEFEPWGLVLNEAMNAGKAVISSDHVGAAADLVRDGVNGYVYPAADVNALAARMRSFVENPARVAAMGKESLRLISAWDFAADARGLRSALERTAS